MQSPEQTDEALIAIAVQLSERDIEISRPWRRLSDSLVWGSTGWMLEGTGWRLYSYLDRKTKERQLSIGHDDLSSVNLQVPLSDPGCLDAIVAAIKSLPRPAPAV